MPVGDGPALWRMKSPILRSSMKDLVGSQLNGLSGLKTVLNTTSGTENEGRQILVG